MLNFKKIKEFILYSGASVIALIVDLILFTIFTEIIFVNFKQNTSIFWSTIISRIISGTVNFCLSKKVFNSKNLKKTAILKYFALGIIQLLSSAVIVILICKVIKIPKTIIKFIVDVLLYVLFYIFQIKFVFRTKRSNI